MQQKIEKKFFFSDNCIWIRILRLSLLRTGFFSSAGNMLTSSRKILHINKRDFIEHNFLASKKWIQERCCEADLNSVWALLQYCFSMHPLKWEFLEIHLTTFSESITSKIQNLWGLPLYSKCLKFNLDFKKIREKFFLSQVIPSKLV